MSVISRVSFLPVVQCVSPTVLLPFWSSLLWPPFFSLLPVQHRFHCLMFHQYKQTQAFLKWSIILCGPTALRVHHRRLLISGRQQSPWRREVAALAPLFRTVLQYLVNILNRVEYYKQLLEKKKKINRGMKTCTCARAYTCTKAQFGTCDALVNLGINEPHKPNTILPIKN